MHSLKEGGRRNYDKRIESDVTMEAESGVSQGMPVDTRNWKKQ